MYSWRLSSDLKSDLEREAHLRKVSVSSVLDYAVRDWLKRSAPDTADDQVQKRLQMAAESCLGAIAGSNPRRAETARLEIRKHLRRRGTR